MYEGKDSFEPVELAAPDLKVVLNESAETYVSLTVVRYGIDYFMPPRQKASRLQEGQDFLYIVNADNNFQFLTNSNLNASSIKLRHPWARDIEGDRVYEATFALDNMVPGSLSGDKFSATAYLTGMSFYSPDDNPFSGAVEQDDSDDYTANYGYPYMPPAVSIQNTSLPCKVSIDVFHGPDKFLREYLAKSKAQVVK